jgi:ABC-type transport system involved in cytochrome bd biosynthesis fused ATPase/permease subunit
MATSSGCFRTDEHGHDGTQSPAPHVGDSHDLIRVLGARVNNLKDVSVEITKRRLTVFTGVSGSGKSSLVFGTIAAESQRLINEYPRRGLTRPASGTIHSQHRADRA